MVAIAAASVAYLTNPAVVPGSIDGYEWTALTVVDDETGKTLAIVNAHIADTHAKHFAGLSDIESLTGDEGVWFVHDSSSTHAYVMRDMDFLLDIASVAKNGTITRIHHAELGPEGTNKPDLTHHRGTGKRILELPHGYTDETGIDVDDRAGIEQERNTQGIGDR